MIEHNAVLEYIIDIPIYLGYHFRVDIVDPALQFEYKHLLTWKIQQHELKIEIKSSSSYN